MSGPNDWDRKNNSAPGNGSVGYGRPPVAKQFKPGQSGNPRGRKKGVKNVATIFNDALYRPVKIRIAGRVRTLPKIEAIVEVMLSKALAGDIAAVSKILSLPINWEDLNFWRTRLLLHRTVRARSKG